ncbi:MAG TPA: hypothetical protein VFY29_15865 [Terriglobia bacterium]|nr:hypothetical protein [Terriglobia bacterium]
MLHASNSTRFRGPRMMVFLVIGLLFMAGSAFAQVQPAAGFVPPDNTPTIKIGLTLYPTYTYQKSPKVGPDPNGNMYSANNFDLSRSYINITGNITHAITYRLTPDIMSSHVTGGTNLDGSLVFRIKYAFAQFSLDDYTGDWKQSWVRVGANQTPFVDWEEGVYRYRFQGTVFSERVGKLTSSDYGASFHTNLPQNYGEIHVGVYNGEGYSKAETNNQKALQARVTIRPLAKGSAIARGVRITGFYDWDHVATDAPRTRALVMALFEHPHLSAGFEFLDARDQASIMATRVRGNGYSFWATPIFKQKGSGPELLLRWDSFIPNRTNTDAKRNMFIAGASYWFPHDGNVSTSILVDVEGVNYPGTSTPTERRVAMHGYLNF